MNHNFEIKDLIETNCISLVMDVINIHAKYIKIVIVIGCLRNFLLKIFLFVILIIKINKTPNIKGSVGNEMLKLVLKFWILIASGVRKTIRRINLSSAKIHIKRIIKTNGNNNDQ
jgi:hypothetical protein